MKTDYQTVLSQAESLISGERDMIANMANISALLYNAMSDVNWVGFYRLIDGELVLGPFQGQPACIRIGMGKGVCGSAAEQQTTLVVEDVHAFAGHIACDAASNSEIVVPIVVHDQLIGVLDIDSPSIGRFDHTDQQALEDLVQLLVNTVA